ncbi:endonuclease domain-containing protein [Mycetocola zhadangensis]|uniref:endonuclease domain-containing protein n=1 Tax=Mycetocola zhadangensis TaxID=1164595 RepID=UPI003A4E2E7E
MELEAWLNTRNGIAHRADALAAGFSAWAIATEVRADRVRVVRRSWLYTSRCSWELYSAAAVGGRLTCVSAAKARGLWTIKDPAIHVAVARNAAVRAVPGVRLHWSRPFVPASRFELIDPVENLLSEIADCQPFENAIVVVDSALRSGMVSSSQLSRWQLRSKAFGRLVKAASQFSDSGIESLPLVRLRRRGIDMRQQVRIDGHPVDGLIGNRLVLQFDGFGPHSDPARRRRDLAQDARLMTLGYTVLRFDYYQVMYDWELVESTIVAAMAQGLHLFGTPASH